MTDTSHGHSSATRPFRFFDVRVAAIEDLTPSMRRFSFVGEDLRHWADPGWDQRIKLVLPAIEGGYTRMLDIMNSPTWYQEHMALPENERCIIRTYTTRSVAYGTACMHLSGYEEGSGTPGAPEGTNGAHSSCAEIADGTAGSSVDGTVSSDIFATMHPSNASGNSTPPIVNVDMVHHAPLGPAAHWIASAKVGDSCMLLGPNSAYEGDRGGVDFIPPQKTGAYLLGGDETAAPAIARILEDLPASARGIAVVELPLSEDLSYLPQHPGFDVRVFGRDGAAHGSLLVPEVARAAAELCPEGTPQEVEEIDIDNELLWEVPRHAKGGAALQSTSLYAWLAGEAAAVRAMRRHLVSERGCDRRTVAFMGYWREGKAES